MRTSGSLLHGRGVLRRSCRERACRPVNPPRAGGSRKLGRDCCRLALLLEARANPHRLRQSQLESALRAAALQELMRLLVPCVPDSFDVASNGSVTHRTRFLTISAEIGVVSQEIELVAERLDDGTGEILRFGRSKVVERLVHNCKGTIFAFERGKMNRRRF